LRSFGNKLTVKRVMTFTQFFTRGTQMSKLLREAKLQIVTRGDLVWISLLVSIAVGLFGLLPLVLGASLNERLEFALQFFLIAIIIFAAVIVLTSWMRTHTKLHVFEDRVELLTKFLGKSSRRIEASKIESVDFAESLLGRHRYGAMTVRGSGVGAIVVSPIQLPEEVAEAIRGIANKSSSKQGKSTSDSGGGDTQSLAELIRMKEQGHLTAAEFTAAKKKLLG